MNVSNLLTVVRRAFLFLGISVTTVVHSQSLVLEDAEDGKPDGWVIYDNDPGGASVSAVDDALLGSSVIAFVGSGTGNGFRLGNTARSNGGWNVTDLQWLSWQMRTESAYSVYIAIDTVKGFRYLNYDALDTDRGSLNGRDIHHGLGAQTRGNTWKIVQRNLAEDLKDAEPTNSLIAVHGIYIRGNLRIDDLRLENSADSLIAGTDESIVGSGGVVVDGSSAVNGTGSTDGNSNTLVDAGNSGSQEVNMPPVAYAGPDRVSLVGETLTLDGSESYDNDGSIIKWQWSSADGGLLGDAAKLDWTPGTSGTHVLTLVVFDDAGAFASDTVQVEVEAAATQVANMPPTAFAGPDLSVTLGERVELDGSGSTDDDGTITSWQWHDSDGTLLGDAETLSWVPVQSGTQTLTLVVTDDAGATDSDQLQLDVSRAVDAYESGLVYEDAEDGSADGWSVYDNDPTGASVRVVNDNELGSAVIKFSGSGEANGYRLGNTAVSNGGWNNTTHSSIRWRMRSDFSYAFYVAVQTRNGFRYLNYDEADSDRGFYGKINIHHGLGGHTTDGSWQLIERNLASDLARVEPGNELVAVHGFLVRGNLLLDDLELYDSQGDPATVVVADNSDALATNTSSGLTDTGNASTGGSSADSSASGTSTGTEGSTSTNNNVDSAADIRSGAGTGMDSAAGTGMVLVQNGPWDPDPTDGPIVQVSDYAVAGKRGQTSRIQKALAAAAGGRLVFGPGVWNVAAERFGALIPAANTTIMLEPGSVLQQEPTSDYKTTLIQLNHNNVHIRGRGTVRGELRDHIGTTGEHTFLVWVMSGARNWSVIGPTFTESWGDGIYVGGISNTGPVIGGLIDYVVADNNRRQGISVTWSESLRIGDNVELLNTGRLVEQMGLPRQRPTAGLDIEPNSWSWVTDASIGAVLAQNNVGNGITVQNPFSNVKPSTAVITGARLIGNGSKLDTYIKGSGIEVKEGGYARLVDIRASGNAGCGVAVRGARGGRTFQGRIDAIGGTSDNNREYGWLLANDDHGGFNNLDNVRASGNLLGDVVELSGQGNHIVIAKD